MTSVLFFLYTYTLYFKEIRLDNIIMRVIIIVIRYNKEQVKERYMYGGGETQPHS